MQAADFLVDTDGLDLATSELADSLFQRGWHNTHQVCSHKCSESASSRIAMSHLPRIDASETIVLHPAAVGVQEHLESLSEDQCLHVLRCKPLQHVLTHLPQSFHRLALLAHHPSVESSKSLSMALMEPAATEVATDCYSLVPEFTALSFRPWLHMQALHEALERLQSLSSLQFLELSGMHLAEAACGALRECVLAMQPRLKSLFLADCGLNKASLRVFLSLPKPITLQELSLSRNKLGTAGCQLLARSLALMPDLRRLDIAYVGLDGSFPEEGPLKFPEASIMQGLSQLPHLEQLDVTAHVRSMMPTLRPESTNKLSDLSHFKHLRPESFGVCSFPGFLPQGDLSEEFVQGRYERCGLQQLLSSVPSYYDELHLAISLFLDVLPSSATEQGVEADDQRQLSAPPHVTFLRLSLLQVSQYSFMLPQIAEELSALNHVMHLEFSGGDELRNDSEVLPFAQHLSSFTCLTGLQFLHKFRHESPCEYVDAFCESLSQLPQLQLVQLYIDITDLKDAENIGKAFSALSNLTSLLIGSPSKGMMDFLTPLLPSQCLQALHLDLDHRAAQCKWVLDHCVSAFALQAGHLTNLRSLCIRCIGMFRADVQQLCTLLPGLQALTKVEMSLLGFPAPASPGGWVPSCYEFEANKLFACLRGLENIEQCSLELDKWYPCAASALFPSQHTSSSSGDPAGAP